MTRPVVMAATLIASPALRERFAAAGMQVVLDPTPADLARADAFVASPHCPLGPAELALATRLAVATNVGTAIHVDVGAATALGIPVLHNRGANADSVAEHTIALLLAVAKNIVGSDSEVRRRERWEVAAPHLTNHELRGKTLGIVGFGAIGARVAHIASAGFGMRVIGCGATPGRVAASGFEELPLHELLSQSDVLSLHLAATPDTVHLIGAAELARLPRHAWLINTARADVLDYDALVAALRNGRIAAAGIDTWPEHRADPDSPLIELPNVVLTQHTAGFTHEAIVRMAQATVDGVREVLAGAAPTASTLVNPQVWVARRRPGADLALSATRTAAARTRPPG